ncbi:hypothetical protein [Pseudomonas sp. NPDC087817]|uniref:hypothetical protein n=1 Tax=Pseudomonas sp. NPDC087817 TaxID=3364451 RepID=UPI003801A09B
MLQTRGFIHQSTNLEELRAHLASAPRSIYLGFDATADSLQVGHLQGLMLMRRIQKAGHRPILLLGGATTRIDDPSFRDESRPVLSQAQIDTNIASITQTFGRYLTLGADAERVFNWSAISQHACCYLKAFSAPANLTKLYLTQATAAQAQRYGHTAQ